MPQGEFIAEADAMHAILVRRADEGCLEGIGRERLKRCSWRPSLMCLEPTKVSGGR